MSTRRPGPKRYTPTTYILIAVLLALVFGASRLVTPPPPGPPTPPPAPKQDLSSASASKDKMKEQEERYRKEMAAQMGKSGKGMPAKPPADPNAIDIDNQYFLKTPPGEKGLKATDEKLAKTKAEYEAYRRQLAASQGKAPGVPPSPAPGQPIPAK